MIVKNDYYQSEEHVLEYINMTKGYDGEELVEILKKHLATGASVLELGMGPGVDFEILKKSFTVTGSDYSNVFLELYRKKHPKADIIKLDAERLETDRHFDCIYSNKVLHHLTTENLKSSLKKQKKLLHDQGILFHSFWRGEKVEIIKGLRFVYYTKDKLIDYFSEDFEIIDIETYKEMETDDSIYVIAKRN